MRNRKKREERFKGFRRFKGFTRHSSESFESSESCNCEISPCTCNRSTLPTDPMQEAILGPRRHIGIHVVIASAVFLGVTALSNGPLKATILAWQTEGRISIAAEHEGSAGLGLDVSTLQGSAIIDCVNEGSGTIFLSLPESWKRREVRNARPRGCNARRDRPRLYPLDAPGRCDPLNDGPGSTEARDTPSSFSGASEGAAFAGGSRE